MFRKKNDMGYKKKGEGINFVVCVFYMQKHIYDSSSILLQYC